MLGNNDTLRDEKVEKMKLICNNMDSGEDKRRGRSLGELKEKESEGTVS